MAESKESPTLTSRSGRLSSRPRLHGRCIADGAIVLAIFLSSLFIYWPLTRIWFNPYDLGIRSYGAVRVASSFIPYVDMHTPYGPAQYYIDALAFELLDKNIGALRVEENVTNAAFSAACYWMLRGSIPRLPALLLTLIVSLISPSGIIYVAMLVAVGCMVRYSYETHARWLIAAGVAIGMVGAIRWDFGIYCALVCSTVLLTLPFLQQYVTTSGYTQVRLREHSVRLVGLLIPATFTAFPFYAPVLFTNPAAFFRSVWLARNASSHRALPWPALPNPMDIAYGKTIGQYLDAMINVFSAYAFPVIGLANVTAVITLWWIKSSVRPSVGLLLHTQITTLLGACLLFYGSSRADLGHLLPSAVFALLSVPLIFWMALRFNVREYTLASSINWVLSAAATGVVVLAFFSGAQDLARAWTAPPPPEPFTAPTLDGLIGDPATAQNYNAMVDYIKRRTDSDEFIFSGNVRHDKLYINDVLIYFASERHAGIRDYHMDPGTTTTWPIQQQIIRDMKRNYVELVVLYENLPNEPNKSIESSGVTELDDYIHNNYVVRERFGSYLVLTERGPLDSPCSKMPDSEVYGYLERASNFSTNRTKVERSGQVRISGWAATPEGDPALDRVEVKVEGQNVEPVIQCIPREDMADQFGKEARDSGWEVLVDLRDIRVSGPINVEAEAIDSSGGHHPLPKWSGFELRTKP